MRIVFPVFLLLPLVLTAAEAKPRTGGAGKADAAVAFVRQDATAPAATGSDPVVRGAYVWGGRADEQYKPFFQWELRLRAGNADLEGLRGRTITLMPDGSDAAVGGWVDFGRLAKGETSEVSIRQNCSAFQSYRLELTWTGGKASFVAADRTTVPVAATTFADMAYLVTTGYQHAAEESKADQKKRGKGFPVSWWLWNIGGAEATEVVQTVRFLDLNGKEVHREVLKRKEPVAAGARLEQTITLKDKPKGYHVISVTADCAAPLVAIGAGSAGFTGATDVELADLAIANGQLSARVRNGLARDLSGLVVTITLLAADGSAVERVPLAVGDLASQGERAVEAAVTANANAFAGYEVGWDVAVTPAPAASTPSGALTVEGLTFTTQAQAVDQGQLFVKGQLRNDRDAALGGIRVTFTATGGGTTATATWNTDSLPVGEPVSVALAFTGLATLESLAMTWATE